MECKARWNGCVITLHQGDITTLAVDAVVNAANPLLMGGGGVDGAIHRRGGPAILQECRQIMAARKSPLPAGEVAVTSGGKLPARWVIHTVGPVYREENRAEAATLLAACYQNSLAALRKQGGRRIAFPCISTGAYGYPPDEACLVAVQAVREDLEQHGNIDEVIFCTFEPDDTQLYRVALAQSL